MSSEKARTASMMPGIHTRTNAMSNTRATARNIGLRPRRSGSASASSSRARSASPATTATRNAPGPKPRPAGATWPGIRACESWRTRTAIPSARSRPEMTSATGSLSAGATMTSSTSDPGALDERRKRLAGAGADLRRIHGHRLEAPQHDRPVHDHVTDRAGTAAVHDPRRWIAGRAREPRRVEHDEIGLLPYLERADIGVDAHRARAVARPDREQLPRAQRAGPVERRRKESGQPELVEAVEPVVTGGAVGPDPDRDAAVAERADVGDPAAKLQVRRWAVRDARATVRQDRDLTLIEVHAVRDHASIIHQADVIEVRGRRPAGRGLHERSLAEVLVRVGVDEKPEPLRDIADGLDQLARAREREPRGVGVPDAPARRLVPGHRETYAMVDRLAGRLAKALRHAVAAIHHRLAESRADTRSDELLGDDVAPVRRPHVQDRRRPRGEQIE